MAHKWVITQGLPSAKFKTIFNQVLRYMPFSIIIPGVIFKLWYW